MPEPIPISSESRANAPNQRNFFDQIRKNDNRLDSLERGSIRSGSVGGAGLRFYPSGSPELTTARIGEFQGKYWDSTNSKWVEEDHVRGLALYEPNQDDPWFIAGSVDNTQFITVGWGGTDLEEILLRAKNIWLQLPGSDGYLHLGPTEVYLQGPSGTDQLILMEEDGDIAISNGSGSNLLLYNIPSVGAGDPLVFDFAGGTPKVKYVVSALKYKQDVEAAEIDPADVLKMQGRTWRDKNEVVENPDTERRFIGFIADELADLPSLRQFVRFNENDEPETIHYDRLSVALLELLKAQQAQIDQQAEDIATINTRLDQLESMVNS